MTTIVCVPGMWLGAWAWREVTPLLAAAGHDPLPVTLTGLAERAAEATAATDLDTHVSDVVRLVEGGDLRDVVLAGHSYAGVVVAAAAGRLAGRVRRIVYVDSGALPEGMSQFDTNPPEQQEAIRAQVGDGYLIPPASFEPGSDADTAPGGVLEGLDADDRAALRAEATGHPWASATQPVRYDPAFFTTPASLITCTFPADRVREMIKSEDPFFALMRDVDVHELPTGHWPMFSRPRDLAALLARIADGR